MELNITILEHRSNGLTIKEIAQQIFRTPKAVEKRLKQLRTLYNAKNDIQLIFNWQKSREKPTVEA